MTGDIVLRCGKCGEEMRSCVVDEAFPGRSAGICPEHGVMYANPAEYE